jgi:hypothetical protein
MPFWTKLRGAARVFREVTRMLTVMALRDIRGLPAEEASAQDRWALPEALGRVEGGTNMGPKQSG